MNEYVGIIIRGENGFLMVHHDEKAEYPWRFPGGKVDPDELLIVAAARELREELGVEATALSYYKSYCVFVDGAKWAGHFFICSGYKGTLQIMEPEKHSHCRYMTSAKIKELGKSPENAVACALDLENGA